MFIFLIFIFRHRWTADKWC